MTFEELEIIYVVNIIGLILLLTLYLSNRGRSSAERQTGTLYQLLAVTAVSCVINPLVYVVDGKSGIAYLIIAYVGNSWLYLGNIVVGGLWIKYLAGHLNIKIGKTMFRIIVSVAILGTVILAVNVFYPIVFSAKDNIYKREILFWLYLAIGVFFILYSMTFYVKARLAGGVLSFFPAYVFVLPVAASLIVQTVFPGISAIWPCIAVSIAGVMTASKNEIIFTDRLTGLFNRTYLDYIQKRIKKNKNVYVTGIMIDLNHFKSINDRFGHAAGDEALIIAADIFRKTVGASGSVMRYAGDEFVILLNTVDESVVNDTIIRINKALDEFNSSKTKPYELSVSCGYSSLDLRHQSMNDFMNTIDRKMYENKADSDSNNI